MKRFSRPAVPRIIAVLVGLVSLPPAWSQPDLDAAAAMQAALVEAEARLRSGETEAAESSFRDALFEGWLIQGAVELARGELDSAAEAFTRASTSAVEIRRAVEARALVELRRNRPAEAVGLLRELLARRPGDGASRRLLARALVEAGKADEAVGELEELADADPGDTETLFILATGYLRLGRPEAAEERFAEVARQQPEAETWLLIGRTYRDFGDYPRARRALETALEIDPQVRRGNYYLGTVDLLEDGRASLEAAEEHFRAELRAFPDDPVAQLYLGLTLVEQRRFEDALAPLRRATEAEEPRPDAFHFLGRALLGLGRLEEAVAALEEALVRAAGGAPDELSSLHYQLALALRRSGREEEAAGHFAEAEGYSSELTESSRRRLARYLDDPLSRGQGDPAPPSLGLEADPLAGLPPAQLEALDREVTTALARTYLNLGVMQAQKLRYDRAAGLLELAAGLAPDLDQVQYSLGVARFNAGRFEAAKAPLATALDHRPGDPDLRRMLALAWLNTDGYDEAAALLEDDPRRATDPALEYAYGLALVRSGRAPEAQQVFDRLIAERADWPELNVLLGQAHAQQGDYEAAERFLRRALSLAPEVAEAHANLGLLYLRRGELAQAETELRAELAGRPQDLRSRYHLATVLDLLGKAEEAQEQLAEVLAREPGNGDARYLLGKILLARGAVDEAVAQLEAAARLQPEEPNVHYQLGQAYQKAGQVELAGSQFELFRELKRRQRQEPP